MKMCVSERLSIRRKPFDDTCYRTRVIGPRRSSSSSWPPAGNRKPTSAAPTDRTEHLTATYYISPSPKFRAEYNGIGPRALRPTVRKSFGLQDQLLGENVSIRALVRATLDTFPLAYGARLYIKMFAFSYPF